MQYEHSTRVGRFTVVDTATASETLSDGSPGITGDELSRLERHAALTVLSELDTIEGSELKFARKALGLTQAELALHLGVTPETVCRWETGKEDFKRQTQLAVLRLLDEFERNGNNALIRSERSHGKLTLRARAS